MQEALRITADKQKIATTNQCSDEKTNHLTVNCNVIGAGPLILTLTKLRLSVRVHVIKTCPIG